MLRVKNTVFGEEPVVASELWTSLSVLGWKKVNFIAASQNQKFWKIVMAGKPSYFREIRAETMIQMMKIMIMMALMGRLIVRIMVGDHWS